ncbi:hypothetical protein RJ639_009949 [Escallonia herrerae]|uniref:ATP binding protein n=1 Tax=Escallonia herrerae TaxID=1293975 RepID=A0AA88VVM6_9ASTE|nr:hypothetical protein RJ639_009949 [Escallonia herrerae]
MDTASTTLVHVSSYNDIVDQPVPGSPTSTDGWGELENGIHEEHENDKDGWDDIEPLEETKPSPALANIQAAQKRPVLQPKPQVYSDGISLPVQSLRPKNVVNVSKDEDSDLWGSIAAPAPKSTSKPLALKPTVALDDDDPWAAIAAPPPTTRAKPLSTGRGRGAKPAAAARLGAQRINRTSSSGM